MSISVMPTQLDIGEKAFQQSRGSSSSGCRGMYMEQQWQMCSTTTTTHTFLMSSRQRNLSGPVTGTSAPALDNRALATPPPGVPGSRDSKERDYSGPNNGSNANSKRDGSSRHHHHRKLDRSLSDSEDRINGNSGGGRGVNSSRYKTELCRPFEESGHCKYGDKCQFAHGAHEMRNLLRHPKYKTELCRTYHSIGFCPYGPRCHFIHNEDEQKISQRKNSTSGNGSARVSSSRQCQMILPPSSSASYPHRPSNLSGLSSLGSSFESVSSSSSPGNLSPSHLEDTFPPIGTFSPSAISGEEMVRAGDSSDLGTIFNFPASDASGIGSLLTPLNIQTQQMYNNVNLLDMSEIARFALLNLNRNQQNDQHRSNFQQQQVNRNARQQQTPAVGENCWPLCAGEAGSDTLLSFPPPCGSPHSNSDDSMGSNGSLELISATPTPTTNLINSPHDLGRAMRLPIFNKLSLDKEL